MTASLAPGRKIVGHTSAGHQIEALTLQNKGGMTATVMTFGATLQRLATRDRLGQIDDIILGHDDANAYWQTPSYQGVTVGRFANRIRNGIFELDGMEHILARNDGVHHLHGGERGFDRCLWRVEEENRTQNNLVLSMISPDGDQGYPGTMKVISRWTLDDDDTLTIAFEATTDRPTIVNLTNHALFNLSGAQAQRPATDHWLTLFADHYTPVDTGLIPTGEVRSVDGTPFDFRKPRRISEALGSPDNQLERAGGYDHNMVLRGPRGTIRPAARLYDPVSGRVLELATSEPGLQVYSGNFLDGSITGKRGRVMHRGDGVCLEPQTFPDAPNQPGFPSARLNPEQTYRHTIRMRCSVETLSYAPNAGSVMFDNALPVPPANGRECAR